MARENTENAIVSSMFEAALTASAPIESFATWLLLGTAAVASFFVSNADKLLVVTSKSGFFTCGTFLCLSCACGLLSKMFALQCKIRIDMNDAMKSSLEEQLAHYDEEEAEIKKGAAFWGIEIESGVRINRVLQEFLAPFPSWTRRMAMRDLNRYAGHPQIGYLSTMKTLQKQGLFAFLQTLSFLAFLASGFIFASVI